MTNFLSSFCILDISPLSNGGLVRIYSYFGAYRFVLTFFFAEVSQLKEILFINCCSHFVMGLYLESGLLHFLFYEVQCGWFYVEVFEPFGLEFYGW